MPLQIAICEDSVADAIHLQKLVQQNDFSVQCKIFASGEEFLLAFKIGIYDLIFMDIYMEGIKGIDVVARIRELDENVMIVFTTTSTDHTLASYRLGVLKYMEKPLQRKDVQETLELAFLKCKTYPFISLLIGGKAESIALNRIYYFEQKNHAIEMKTIDGSYRVGKSFKLADIEERLSSLSFLRCHHSYIVNLRYVQTFNKELKVFILKNGDTVHIRRGDIKKAREAYEAYLFATVRGEEI